MRQLLVADEGVAIPRVLQRLVHLELASGAALGLLRFHGGMETCRIHFDTGFAADVGRQVQRKTIGIVQLEGHITGQQLGAVLQGLFQNFHAGGQSLEEALFFDAQHLGDALLVGAQLGVGLAHQNHQVRHQLVEERRLLAQLVAVADGAAHDAALHIAAAFIGWNHAVAHQEGGGADVVGNHAQGFVAQVGLTGLARCGLDQRVKQVDLVVAVHVLQDGGQALQAHAGVHAGGGQRGHSAGLVHVELHEHVVPDLDEAVAVFFRAAGRAAGNVVAVVVEDFRAGAARPCIGHHPEVVALVASALVVADADHALGRQTNDLGPDVVGLVVFLVNGGQQALLGQLVNLGQQFPGPEQALLLEVVAKAPVAQHFEEGVVARGVAHIFQIVVLAAGAQAGLHRSSAHIGTFVSAQEHVLELNHAGVGEHQRRVIAGNERAARHHGVALGGKEV